MSSIEYDFFILISQRFPLLEDLTVINRKNQNKQSEDEQTSSIIEYSHLMTLNLNRSHVDYAKQFLLDTNIRVPRLRTLVIEYEKLVNVTENFTNNAVHAKCKNLEKIIFSKEYRRIIIGENFSTYFPCLKYQ
jgi:predicted transcriptional regulator